MKKFKAVIFDLDGTLLDTVEDIAVSVNKVLTENNLPCHTLDDYRLFVGRGIAKLVEQATPRERHTESFLKKIYSEVINEYSKNLDRYTKPYQGIDELLDGLTFKNIKMAILSNKAHEFMADVVNSYFKNWSFEVVFGARKNIPTKPNPYSVFEMLQIMQLKPAEVVYVGDTEIDMQTANAAGLYSVGVAWGFRKRDVLVSNGAKVIIDYPHELLRLFN